MNKRLLAVLLILSIFLASCKAEEEPLIPLVQDAQSALDQAASYEVAECPFATPNYMQVDAECGYLAVPEDRSEPFGDSIRLATAVLKSPVENPLPDPVVMIFYNPGATLDFAPGIAYFWGDLLEERDLVILEQRGTGHSQPAFGCSQLRDVFYQNTARSPFSSGMMDLSRDALAGCLQNWQSEEIDLKGFNSEATAADLEDLRLALGYEQWNLYGVGYGSYIAYLVMRDFSQGLRSVLIDSSIPATKEMLLREPANTEAALHNFFELCRADKACNDAYPDLENRFYRLASDFDASPETLAIKNPQSGERYDFYVDGSALVQFASITVAISNERFTPELPRLISEAEMGNTATLANMLGELIQIFEPPVEGMQWLATCKESMPLVSLDERLAAMAGVNEHVAAYYEKVYSYYDHTCEVFENLQVPTPRMEAVNSGVPTLSITGQMAPFSSAEWAKSAAANLDKVTLVDVTGGTTTGIFGASWQSCPNKLVKEFFSDPNTQLDTSCADDMPAIRWITFQQ